MSKKPELHTAKPCGKPLPFVKFGDGLHIWESSTGYLMISYYEPTVEDDTNGDCICGIDLLTEFRLALSILADAIALQPTPKKTTRRKAP